MISIEEYKRQAKMCMRCTFCKFIDLNWVTSLRFSRQCPIDARYAFNLYSPHGLLHSALAELDGELEFTPKLMEALYQCTLCGACDARCKRNIDKRVLPVIENLRVRCVEQGKGPMPEHKVMADNIRKTKNEYGEPHEDRLKWLTEEIKPAQKADIVYFVGCNSAYKQPELAQATAKNQYGEPHEDRLKWLTEEIKPAQKADIVYFVGCNSAYKQPELAQATAKILRHTGTEFMLLADEWCAGNYVLATGQVDLARELAEHNVQAIQESGAKTVITSSAECYKSLKVDYPKLLGKSTEDMPYTPLHITEYLDKLMKDGKLKFSKSVQMKVTYHDPCNLGRLSEPWQEWVPKYVRVIPIGKVWRGRGTGIYDPPRKTLKGLSDMGVV